MDRHAAHLCAADRADCVGDPVPSGFNQTIDSWFDVNAFAVPALLTYGNCGENSVRGPGLKNVDMSLIKNTKFGNVSSELRLEVFNLFNFAQFNNPNGVFGNAAFGTISSIVASPSCATCGTTERQIQLAVKLKF